MKFDLETVLSRGRVEGVDLAKKLVSPQFGAVLKLLGYDIRWDRGEGAYLFDAEGRRYLDCLAGYGVFNIGRHHPVVREALHAAMEAGLPNLVQFGAANLSGLLAEKLLPLTPGDQEIAYFCSTGAEACETAIKFARAATKRERVLSASGGYHGLTMGALSCTGHPSFQNGFGTMLPGCEAVAFDDLDVLEAELKKGGVAGFMVEPIQGKGVRVPSEGYLREAQALCHRHGALLIADEVQTGMGRTGKLFACEHWGVEPDIVLASKALSGGYIPVAAVMTSRKIYDGVFSSMDRCVVHSSTFGQNDLAMVAGLATLHVLEDEKIIENAAARGEALMAGLRERVVERYDMPAEVRGKGLMVGVTFEAPRGPLLRANWSMIHAMDPSLFPQTLLIPLLTEHGVLAQTGGHGMDLIKLTPSLTIGEEDVAWLVDGFEKVVADAHRVPGPLLSLGRKLAANAFGGKKG